MTTDIKLIAVLPAFIFLLPQSMPPHSEPPTGGQSLTQVWGGYCQTPFSICPLIDPNGNTYQAPVGSPCFCGQDSGTVIQ